MSQEAGVIIFPAGSLDTGPEEGSPGQEQAGSEQEQETETETDTEPRFVRVPVDVVETRQGTHFAVDAPGIDRDAMKVEVRVKAGSDLTGFLKRRRSQI